MNRFINCDCIKNKKGELIPLWKIDWKLDSEYLDKDDLENSFIVPEDRNIGDFIAETDIVKALWDLINKKVVPCKRVIKIYSVSTGRVGLKEGDEVLEKLVKLGYKQPIKEKRIEVEIVEWIRLHKDIIILVYPFTNKEGEKRFIFAIPMENGSLSSNNLNYPSYEQARLEGIKSVCNELLRK